MSVKRIITALVGLPIVIGVLILSNKYIIDFLVGIVVIIAIQEYSKCCKEKAKIISWIGYLCGGLIMCLHIIPSQYLVNIQLLFLPIVLTILFLHVIITNMKINFKDIAYTLFGICYIGMFLIFVPLTYGVEGEITGKILIWYIFIAAWGTDTFAYIIGRNIGKHKFSKISPNKTIEGCISGIFGAVTICILYTIFVNNYFGLEISILKIGIIGIILSIVGQIGDFSASVIKRYFEIKDFSELFPGHGGLIDRIDSVMFISPFAYLLLTTLI